MLIIQILLSFSVSLFNQPVPIDNSNHDESWLTNYEQAIIQAEEQNRPILMVFSGSDWCKPCIKLRKEVFDQEIFIEYANAHFILLHLDFPRYKKNRLSKELRDHHDSIAEKFNPKGEFPLVLLLDPKGEKIAKTGYVSGGPDNYIAHLKLLTQDEEEIH